jgi:hypothetical protein
LVSAAVFQFAQVDQARFQVAQLGVVQAAGDFLAVARDERHRGAFIQQRDGGQRLRGLGADLVGDGLGDLARERCGEFCHCVGFNRDDGAAIVASSVPQSKPLTFIPHGRTAV